VADFYKKINEKFNSYYKDTWEECEKGNKAKKDIVGTRYEKFKVEWVKSYSHLDVATPAEISKIKKDFGGTFNADIYIVDKKTRELLALEEDKGHYVDKCFLKRALMNAVDTIVASSKNNKTPPKFILSSPTSYAKVSEILDSLSEPLKKKHYNSLKNSFIYAPLCQHGRVQRNKYLKSSENPFKLDEDLCYNQHRFYMNLQERSGYFVL